MRDVQVAEEAFSSQKEHPAHEIFFTFSISVGHLALLDPDPDLANQNQCRSIRIRNHNTVYILSYKKFDDTKC
jgi:hypothetical protein